MVLSSMAEVPQDPNKKQWKLCQPGNDYVKYKLLSAKSQVMVLFVTIA